MVGGWLTENYSWRWVFYINLPFGIISLLMTRAYVFDPPYLKRESKGIDYWGMGMLVVGIGALQYVLDKGQQDDWFANTTIAVLAIVSAVTLTALIVQQLLSKNPIVDLRLFKDRSYAVGVFLDDGARLRAVRQPGAAAGDAADAVRVLVVPGGAGDGAARGRLAGDDAGGGHSHRADRPATPAGHGTDGRRHHAALARAS